MPNLNQPEDMTSILKYFKAEKSDESFKELLDNRETYEVYIESLIPLYQALLNLYNECRISKDEFSTRISTIMRLLQLIEEFISKSSNYKTTAIFLIDDAQHSPFYLKVLQGLLHSEDVYPVVIESPISTQSILQVINNYKADSLFLIHSKSRNGLVILPKLDKIKFRNLSYPDIQQLIDSYPAHSKKSIRFYDWLCGEHRI